MTAFAQALAARADALGIDIRPDLVQPLESYFSLLARWNRTVNLTALPVETLADEAIDRLLLEPIAAARFFPDVAETWIDLGTGGGSPAIPLKLIRLRTRLQMVESRSRKVAFLRELVRQLGLACATAAAQRFEAMAERPEWTARADIVTARAVRVDAPFIALVEQLLKPRGLLMLFETDERRAIQSSYLQPAGTHELIRTKPSRLNLFSRTI